MLRKIINIFYASLLCTITACTGVNSVFATEPIAAWHFETVKNNTTNDIITGINDKLYGNYKIISKGVDGKCLKLDGLSSYMERKAEKTPKLSGAFSIEVWIALQEYPWNWTAILDHQKDHKAGYFLGIDYQGAIGFGVGINGKWAECNNAVREYNSILHTDAWQTGSVHTMIRADRKLQFSVNGVGDLESATTLESDKWTHIAVVYSSSDRSCRFYLNGKLDSTVAIRRPVKTVLSDLQIGGWAGEKRNYKGLMDDFRIYNRALEDSEIAGIIDGNCTTEPIVWWKFDEESGDMVSDSANAHNGTLIGGSFIPSKNGNALSLDGIDQHVRVPAIGSFEDLTVSVWVKSVIISNTLPLHTWNHVVGTYDPHAGIAIYLNGMQVSFRPVEGKVTEPEQTNLLIGYSHEKLAPVQTERGPSMVGSNMLLSGLIDEVKIYNSALSADEVKRAFAYTQPAESKPLKYNLMPTGVLGKGEFGASQEELKYCDSWDETYRMSGPGDVVVKFDELPVNYVFWHGWNYGLCMVTENGLLMADQSVERGNENGCTEHMSDKQNRFSHIRIIENHDARIVLHWRYCPCDIFYNATFFDANTGWGDWVDEYFYIYPDGVMMREQKCWTIGDVERRFVGGYGGMPSNQETVFFSQPGKGPLDTVEVAALTVINDEGQSRTFSWQPEFPWAIGREPEKSTIQMVNFKSVYKPYMIRRPGATIAAFPPSGFIDRNFPYWNHWPVCQLPNDGRKGTRTDRPAHTSLTWFCEPPIKAEGILYTWIYMYGLTDKKATELVTVSKSWNSPPALNLQNGNFENMGFDTCQRAYILNCLTPGKTITVNFTLQASENSPIVNPAFIIKNWGDTGVKLKLDGREITRGKTFRFGYERRLDGTDLVLWIKYETELPLNIELQSI